MTPNVETELVHGGVRLSIDPGRFVPILGLAATRVLVPAGSLTYGTDGFKATPGMAELIKSMPAPNRTAAIIS